jgi:hypothetical protein
MLKKACTTAMAGGTAPCRLVFRIERGASAPALPPAFRPAFRSEGQPVILCDSRLLVAEGAERKLGGAEALAPQK